MFGELNEAKISLAKYSVEFNDFAGPQRPHRKTVFEAVRQTLHISRSVNRITMVRLNDLQIPIDEFHLLSQVV